LAQSYSYSKLNKQYKDSALELQKSATEVEDDSRKQHATLSQDVKDAYQLQEDKQAP